MAYANSGATENLRTAPPGSAMGRMYKEGMEGNDEAFFDDIPQSVQIMRADHTKVTVSTEVHKVFGLVV